MNLKIPIISSLEEWDQSKILSVLGTTGSGKSQAVHSFLRTRFTRPSECLLVSLDSVAAYKELNIASAKATREELEEFHYCGIDLFEIPEKVEAASFRARISEKIGKALEASQPVIFVGGSHFYERYILEGAAPGAKSCPDFQKSLEAKSNEELFGELCLSDNRWKEKLNENDRFRITRAFDLHFRQKLSFDELYFEKKDNGFSSITQRYIHSIEKKEVAIHARVERMFQKGLLDEVEGLLKKYNPHDHGMKTMGYAECVDFLENNGSKAELIEKIKIRHCQLAKKQRTWLRNLK